MPPASSPAWRFLVDENLPRSLAIHLQAAGYGAEHMYGAGLRSIKDPPVFAYAQAHGEAIVTHDKGFGNLQAYPPPHAGIVLIRLPDQMTIANKINIILAALASLTGQPLADAVVTVEPGRTRVHR